MKLMRYSPEERVRRFGTLSHLLDEVLGHDSTEMRSGWLPAVDIKETPAELAFFIELPGMRQEDIEVEMVGEMLTVRGKRQLSSEEKRDSFVRIERSYGAFQRSFSVSVPVKADEIKASYKDGVLEVVVPKADEIKPRKITINPS